MHAPTSQPPARPVVTRNGTNVTSAQLHAILALRTAVFVVEQRCSYQEVDGLDLRPDTWHRWLAATDTDASAAATRTPNPDGTQHTAETTRPAPPAIVAYLRVLTEPGGYRIGRVVTRADHRGQGLSARLVDDTIGWLTGRHGSERPSVVLSAQSHLERFYHDRGFTVTGPTFVEDGIAHVPMARRLQPYPAEQTTSGRCS